MSSGSTPSSVKPATTSSPSSPGSPRASAPDSRFVHLGMTSSDVLDTCLAVPADPGDRPPHRGHRRRAGGAQGSGLRPQAYADHRPQPRHPCRAHQLRPQARRPLRRIRPQPGAAGHGAGRDRHLRHLRGRRHLCPSRHPGRGLRRRPPRPRRRAGFDPGDPARPSCGVVLGARGRREQHRTALHRSATSPALRGARGGGVSSTPGRRGRARCRTSATPC